VYALTLKDVFLARVGTDRFCLGAIVLIGILTHFLFPLSEPRVAYFDEVGYGPLVAMYLTGQKPSLLEGGILDIHPPHGKLVTAGVAHLLGYRDLFEFDEQKNYPPNFDIFSLRFFPALCGVLIPLLFFLLARESGIGSRVATLASLGLCLDNGLIAHTRMLSTDGLLLVGALLSFFCYLKSRTRPAFSWVVLAGMCAGLVFGTKFTGLSVGAFLTLAYCFRERSPSRALIFSASMLFVYVLGWWVHYQWIEGGDVFFARLLTEHRQMIGFNQAIKVGNISASPWWSWPIGGGAIWLFQGNFLYHQSLWELGNFFFRFSVLIVFVVSLVSLRNRRSEDTVFWALAFAVSYLPYAFIGRYMFAYHYFLPLIWSLLVAGKWLEGRLSVARFWDGAVIFAMGFALLVPVTYRVFAGPAYVQFLYDHFPHFW